jgi:hypothetical protein
MSRHRQPGPSRMLRVSFHADARVLSRLPNALFVPSPFETCNAIFALSQPFEFPRVSPRQSTFDFTTKTTWTFEDSRCVFPRRSARVKPGATAFVYPLALLRPATLCVPCLSLSSFHACFNTSRPSMSRHRQPGPSRTLRVSFHVDARVLSRLRRALSVLLAVSRAVTLCVPCLNLSSSHAYPHASLRSMSRNRQPAPSRMLRVSFHADPRVLSRFPKAFFVP